MQFTSHFPTRLLFGAGQLDQLHRQPMPGKKALLFISNGRSARESGALDRTQRQLALAGADFVLFDQVGANPLKATVEAGAALAAHEGCDFVVALGGGSVLDAAKVMAMFALQPGDLWDYAGGATGKGLTPPNPILPVITITTTAGTGSEVDNWGVITNPETHEKIGVGRFPDMFPVFAIVDPELMRTVPPRFTAYQGFDALFHSTEGFLSRNANLMSDMVELSAIEHVGHALVRAVRNGDDMDAREEMAFANTMSGYSMVLGSCTSEHALEHAMSAYHQDLPHGAGLIMISRAYYTHFIQNHACDERFVRMARALGTENAREPMDFVAALTQLQKDCGVDDLRMSDFGIRRDELRTLARSALAAMPGLFRVDRIPLTEDDCVAIYEASWR